MAASSWGGRQGSSPLTRGKLDCTLHRARCRGLIPAHAGKTTFDASRCSRIRAHPRSRGENPMSALASSSAWGSSPLTRGKPGQSLCIAVRPGLIPAHAGKTRTRTSSTCLVRAHPRSRGENHASHLPRRPLPGSSPLTRGKHFLTCAFITQIGQILESRELCASSESYSLRNAYATAAPPDQVRSIGLAPRSSRDAS